jgi:hypothetical protein
VAGDPKIRGSPVVDAVDARGAEAPVFSGWVVAGDQFPVKISSNFPVGDVDVFR